MLIEMGMGWMPDPEVPDGLVSASPADYVAEIERLRAGPLARPESEWHEDFGPVLWWTNPVNEPPYSGTPLDEDWPGYHTHWTPITSPTEFTK